MQFECICWLNLEAAKTLQLLSLGYVGQSVCEQQCHRPHKGMGEAGSPDTSQLLVFHTGTHNVDIE